MRKTTAGLFTSVDGVVQAGRSSIDTSTMTGEAAPVEVEPGSAVAAGTVNGAGSLTLVAERVGVPGDHGVGATGVVAALQQPALAAAEEAALDVDLAERSCERRIENAEV